MTDFSKTATAATSAPAKADQLQQQAFQWAVQGGVQKIYANSIGIGQSPSDVDVLLMLNNSPVATLILPYGVAKSLIKLLQNSVDLYEKANGHPIKPIEEMIVAMEAQAKSTGGG